MDSPSRRNSRRHVENNRSSSPPQRKYSRYLSDVILHLPPFAILSIVVIVVAYGLKASPGAQLSRKAAVHSVMISSSNDPPSLTELVSVITDMLDYHKVTYWLMPGLGLLPATDDSGKVTGRLAPWREGIDFGVNQSDLMKVIVAQTALQPRGIVAVESYFGLRLFSLNGHRDERYDYNAPFVDLVYFQSRDSHVVSYCCDCEPIVASACTKKTCGCLICAASITDLFPLQNTRIEGIDRDLPAPATNSNLHLSPDIENVHPALFDRVH